jgi:hypothetical protein
MLFSDRAIAFPDSAPRQLKQRKGPMTAVAAPSKGVRRAGARRCAVLASACRLLWFQLCASGPIGAALEWSCVFASMATERGRCRRSSGGRAASARAAATIGVECPRPRRTRTFVYYSRGNLVRSRRHAHQRASYAVVIFGVGRTRSSVGTGAGLRQRRRYVWRATVGDDLPEPFASPGRAAIAEEPAIRTAGAPVSIGCSVAFNEAPRAFTVRTMS